MKDTTQTFRAPGCGGRLHQRREPRLLLLRVHGPRPCWRWASAAASLKASERVTLVGDEWRMIRAGRHDIGTYLDLAAACRRRRHAVGDRRRGRTGRRGRRRGGRRQPARPPTRRGFALVSVRCSRRWGCRAGPTIPTGCRAVAPRCSRCLATRRDDTAVQQRARTLAQAYLTDRSAVPPSIATAVLRTAAAGGDQGAVRPLRGRARPDARRRPRSSTAS